MTAAQFHKAVQVATVAVHLTVACMLVLVIIPSFGNIADQIRSGYIPPGYWLLPLLILVSIALSAAIVVGLIRWLRGSRRTLICVDIAVFVMSWSFLIIFVFSNDVPVVNVVLAPVALVLAWLATPVRIPDLT
jgi:thiosulfate reductase cytochrome b subunit